MLNAETLQEQETILCAAIHINNNIIYDNQPTNINVGFVVGGYRHVCCKEILSHIQIDESAKRVEGFITNYFRFVSRTEAFQIAKNAKQIISNIIFEELASLVSEDLY
jgi:hypothetical protein